MDMFKEASKLGIRYTTARGLVSVEALWDIPLEDANGFSLDDIAKTVAIALAKKEEQSFVAKKSTNGDLLSLKLEVIKAVIADRLEEKNAKINAAKNAQIKEKIGSIIASRDDDALRKLDTAKLKEMFDGL